MTCQFLAVVGAAVFGLSGCGSTSFLDESALASDRTLMQDLNGFSGRQVEEVQRMVSVRQTVLKPLFEESVLLHSHHESCKRLSEIQTDLIVGYSAQLRWYIYNLKGLQLYQDWKNEHRPTLDEIGGELEVSATALESNTKEQADRRDPLHCTETVLHNQEEHLKWIMKLLEFHNDIIAHAAATGVPKV